MSRQNQPPSNNDYSPLTPPSFYNNDEVDLRELIKVLWDCKLIIALSTLVFALSAVVYAFHSQEWWSSKVKIIPPQEQDIAAYQKYVKQYQPIFDVYQDDGTVLISHELKKLTDAHILFKRFIEAVDSRDNKRHFLNSSKEFQTFRTLAEGQVAPDKMRSFYASWIEKITTKKLEENDDFYEIAFQSMTKESSYSLLNQYIETIIHKTHQDALNNLKAIVDGKHNELIQQRKMLESQAETKLLAEIERAKFALEIAKSAGVTQPIQTNSIDEIFDIELGAKAIEAKIKALDSIKELSVMEPRLQQVYAKLMMLESLNVDSSIQFQTVSFFENVEQPITRDKPKRALIVVLGTMLGGILGVAIALIRFALRRT